jgi:hypothetical protein
MTDEELSFEDELDEYITRRRGADERREKRSFFKRFFSWRQSRKPKTVEEKRERELEDIEHDIEVIEEEEEDLEEVREGLMTKFFKLLRGSPSEQEEQSFEEEVPDGVEEEEEVDVVEREKVKELVKIQHKWIQELGTKDLSRFRRSPDFERYKELLQELGFAK